MRKLRQSSAAHGPDKLLRGLRRKGRVRKEKAKRGSSMIQWEPVSYLVLFEGTSGT